MIGALDAVTADQSQDCGSAFRIDLDGADKVCLVRVGQDRGRALADNTSAIPCIAAPQDDEFARCAPSFPRSSDAACPFGKGSRTR
jgi:hypothetical protein